MSGRLSGRAAEWSVESYRPCERGQDPKLRPLLAEWPLATQQRFGCYRIAGNSHYSDIARRLECEVFQQFFANDPSCMCAEYAPYEADSMFLLVIDQERQQAAGALRIIAHSDRGFKTLNDIAREPLSIPTAAVIATHQIDRLDKCWDIGTVAVLKEYRGKASNRHVSSLLYALLTAETRQAGIDHVVTIVDQHVFTQLTELFGIPFVPIANSPPFSYLGSARSRAAYAFVPQVKPSVDALMNRLDESVLRQLRPYLTAISDGEGLPKVVVVS